MASFLLSLRTLLPLLGVGVFWVFWQILQDELVELLRKFIPDGGFIMFAISHPNFIPPAVLLIVVACLAFEYKRRKSLLEIAHEEIASRTLRDATGNITGEPVFAELSVASQVVDAREVRSFVTFYDKNGRKEFSMRGRWSNSLERRAGAKPHEQEVRDVKVEYPEPLLIALKYKDKDLAYGLNRHNETKKDWTDSNKPLPKGKHTVKITFESPSARKRFEFKRTLVNKGIGHDLEWQTNEK